jgi:hypothetical protein
MSKKTKLGIAIFCGIFCLGVFLVGNALRTEAVTGPIISNVTSGVYLNTATISWKTDVSATAKVEYGKTSGQYTDSKEVIISATSFRVTLQSLSYDTTYYYRIKATDANNNSSNSQEYTFTTSSQNLKFESIYVQSVTSDKAVVVIKTNMAAWGDLKYGASTSNLDKLADNLEILAGIGGSSIYHKTLTDLKPETTYYYQVTSTIYENNQPEQQVISEVKSFKTTGLPLIESINPTSGPIGTEITISGKNFGAETDTTSYELARQVAIGCGMDYPSLCLADVISWNNEKIVAKIKKGVVTGNVYLGKYFNIMGLPFDMFTIKGPKFTFSSGTAANTNTQGAVSYVSEAYGCKYSTTTKDSSTVQVQTLFTKGSTTDTYLKNVYDAYYAAWSRYPRCDELQFQLDHSTPIDTLKSWLAKNSVTEKYGCKYSTSVSDENTVRLSTLFKLDSDMDKYLNSVYNAYFEAWGRYPRCDELEFHAVHNTPIEKLKTWLLENKPEKVTEAPTTFNESLEKISGPKIEFKESGTKIVLKSEDLKFTEKDQITFTGKTVANSIVVLTVASEPAVYTTKSDKDGNWVYTLPGPLTAGDHSVKVSVLDENSQIVRESDSLAFTVSASKTSESETKEKMSLGIFLIVVIVALVLILFVIMLTKKRKTV